MEERFRVLRLDEVDGYADEGRPRWHMIRAMLGIESFGVNAWRATEAGQTIIGDHDELGQGAGGHEELYFVLSGRATFTVDGEPVAAPAGSLVFVKDPRARRSAIANEAGTTVLAIGGRPGAAFSISPWERSAEALRFWTTGEWDRAVAVLQTQLAEDPGNANVLYNLACAESRGGHRREALAHLRQAVDLEPRFRALAHEDADLEAIRDDAGFPGADPVEAQNPEGHARRA
jgi:tetratricopeptide (TPR) repeat protein